MMIHFLPELLGIKMPLVSRSRGIHSSKSLVLGRLAAIDENVDEMLTG